MMVPDPFYVRPAKPAVLVAAQPKSWVGLIRRGVVAWLTGHGGLY